MSDITMEKIAELAGVSRATVSRVLCDPEKVRPETRAKIQHIMDEFGYSYHAGAAELTKRKTSLIGLVIPTALSTAFSSTILAVQEAALQLGMSLVLGCSEFEAGAEAAILRQFLARRVAGIIMVGYAEQNEALILRLQNSDIPTVIISTTLRNPNLCEVGFDNVGAAAKAVRYLIEIGHRRIAAVTGPTDVVRRAADRLEGYRQALEEKGIAIDPRYHRSTMPSIANGEAETLSLLAVDPPPTAVFAAGDILAIGALSAARKMGLSIPEDLSVVGLDGNEFSSHTNPPFTTIAVPEKEMALMASRLLKQLINKEVTPPRSYCLETELIVRKSCAPPRERVR